MTTRERRLAYVILAFIVVAGAGFIGYQFYLQPMNIYARQISELDADIERIQTDINKIVAERNRLAPYVKISLPFTPNTQATADILRRTDVARGKYVEKLIDMLQKTGFTSVVVNDKKPENKSTPQFKMKAAPPKGKDAAIYTRLEFNVDAKGNVASLAKWMEQFYRLQLLHQIKNMTVMRPLNPTTGAKPNELDVKMTIEALVLEGAEQRKTLEPTTPVTLPPVLAQDRDYASIAGKDLFYGPAPVRYSQPEPQTPFVDANPHIMLTEVVTKAASGPEAKLWNRYHGQLYTIQPRKAGDGYYVERSKDVNGVSTTLGPSTPDIRMYDDDDEPKEPYSWTVIKLLDEGLVLKGSTNPKRHPTKTYHLLRPGRFLNEAEPLSKADLKRLGINEEKEKDKTKPEVPVEDPAQAKKDAAP
jgi:hypothetical protein